MKDTWRRVLYLNVCINLIASLIWSGTSKAPLFGAALMGVGILQLVAATYGLRHRKMTLLTATVAATFGVEILGLFDRPDSENPGLMMGTILGLMTAGIGAATLRQLRGVSANLIAPAAAPGVDPFLGSPPTRAPRSLLSEIGALLKFEPTRALATPGVIGTVIAAVSGTIWATWTLIYYRREIIGVSDTLQDNPLVAIVRNFFQSDILDLLFGRSFILQAALFATVVMVTPFLAILLSTDQTANDSHTHNMRFLLQRLDRRAIYFGRALSVSLGWWVLVVPLIFGASLALGSFDPKGFGAEHMAFAAKSAAIIGFYGTPFAAVMAAVNAVVSRPALAIGLALGYWMLISIGSSAIENAMNKDSTLVSILFPTHFKTLIISPHMADIALGAVGLLVQSGVYLALGWIVFKRRDV